MMVEDEVAFVKCEETGDIQGQLDYWRKKYADLIGREIPPWIECREAIDNIERLEKMLDAD